MTDLKYAIIKLQGKQYRVEEGMELTVDRMSQDEKASVLISDVLMVVHSDNVQIGTPMVTGAKVKVTVLKHEKGDKIRVATYKAKSRQRKVHGHRQAETVLHIDAISAK